MSEFLVSSIKRSSPRHDRSPVQVCIYSTTWLPGLCFAGSASGAELLKYWIHFSIFLFIMIYLWKRKIEWLLRSWADEINQTILKNTQLLNEALENKSEIEMKLSNVQSEIEQIIQEAHQTGKSRRESLLNQLREEIKLRLRYKEQLENELKRSLNEAFRSYIMSKSKELVLKQLSRISSDDQIKFFEQSIFKANSQQESPGL